MVKERTNQVQLIYARFPSHIIENMPIDVPRHNNGSCMLSSNYHIDDVKGANVAWVFTDDQLLIVKVVENLDDDGSRLNSAS